jgi:hypothetical protein
VTYRSTVPRVMDALVTLFRTHPEIGGAGVPVRDGPTLSAEQALWAVAVGYTGDENESIVSGSSEPIGLAPTDHEQYEILCAAVARDPGGSMATARADAYQLHDLCGRALTIDGTMGGLVLSIAMGISSLRQQQVVGAGAEVTVIFPVNVEAFATT